MIRDIADLMARRNRRGSGAPRGLCPVLGAFALRLSAQRWPSVEVWSERMVPVYALLPDTRASRAVARERARFILAEVLTYCVPAGDLVDALRGRCPPHAIEAEQREDRDDALRAETQRAARVLAAQVVEALPDPVEIVVLCADALGDTGFGEDGTCTVHGAFTLLEACGMTRRTIAQAGRAAAKAPPRRIKPAASASY